MDPITSTESTRTSGEDGTPESDTQSGQERRVAPLRRVFERYFAEVGTDGTVRLKEKVNIWDDRLEGYKQKTQETAITFTGTLLAQLAKQPELLETVIARCTSLRLDLDGRLPTKKDAAKIYYDPNAKTGSFDAGWKYTLDGVERSKEYIAEFPKDIMALVTAHERSYFTMSAYKKWYGTALQAKREEIISRQLASEYPDAQQPTVAMADSASVEPESRKAIESEVWRELQTTAASVLAGKMETLFVLPSRMAEYVTFLTETVLEVIQKANPEATAEDAKCLVREALLARHRDNHALLAQVQAHMPAQPLASVQGSENE